jgi:hypothetical protein
MSFHRTTVEPSSRRGGFFRLSLTLLFALSALATSYAQAKTWYIKADNTEDAAGIQAGIESVAAGDTVLSVFVVGDNEMEKI